MSREQLTPDEIAALFAVDCNDESDDNDEDDGDNLDKLMEYLANDYDKSNSKKSFTKKELEDRYNEPEEYEYGILSKEEINTLLRGINDKDERYKEYLDKKYKTPSKLFSSKDEIIKELCKLTLYDITIDEVPLIIDGTKKTYYNLRAVVPADKVLSQGEIDIIVKSLKRGYRIPQLGDE